MNKNVYIGYDSREDIAYQVSKFSILNKSDNINVNPLKLKDLRENKMYWRGVEKDASTEFTISRFLIPELNDFTGWALFCDCDILFLKDTNNLFDLADEKYAVMCVQHNYAPKENVKMDGKTQIIYPRKNWSSLVLWNCSHPSNKLITKEFVNSPDTSPKYLHRFSWLKDEEIGSLPHQWNWLAGWYEEPKDGFPCAIHYTEGGPWFENYRHCEYHQIWKDELNLMMNNSV